MKNKLTIITLISFITIIISCRSNTNGNIDETNSTISNDEDPVDLSASEFVKKLKTGEKLSVFFKDNWTFVYHEDNRCNGTTKGQMDNLKSTQIDSKITLQVKNDGDGWACEKKEPKTYYLDFEIKRKVAAWDRFEIPRYENQESQIVYILGAGESDYLKLYYDTNNLIVKLEYRSEDPG